MGQGYSYITSYWYSSSNNIDDTISKLSKQHDHLSRKIIEMENKKTNIQSMAIQEFKKQKSNKALSLMKIKKLYELEITKIENLLFCIATQELALNSSCTLQDSMSTIKHASCTMKALNTDIDLSKIENTIDVVNDTHDLNNEIQDAMNHQNFIQTGPTTDDDLLQELRQLSHQSESDLNSNTFINITPIPNIVEHNKKPPPPPASEKPCEVELQSLNADKLRALIPDINKELSNKTFNNPTPELAM